MSAHTHLFGRLHEHIQAAERILLVAHKKPDGDTIGSSSSVLNWLIREGKDVHVFCRDVPHPQFHYIDNIHRYTTNPRIFHEPFDLVIVFDSGDLRYCGVDEHIPNLPPGYTLVNVDHHHLTNNRFGHLNIVIGEASSTAEIVYQLYEACGISIDAKMATSLLTGIFTDTSSFSNAATSTKAMEAASALLAFGARYDEILKYILRNKTVASLKSWGLMLSRLNYNATYDVASTYLTLADQADDGTDGDGPINFLSAIVSDADTVMVLRETHNGLVKGSLRSVNRNVSAVAKLLGGGGHKKAAGFAVKGRIEQTPEGPRIVDLAL